MSFKEEFLRTPPGPKREQLIYDAAIKQGKPTNLVPVTVTLADGTKIVYRVMSDYLMIGDANDKIRVPISGNTAQRIADYFGMSLPTPKMVHQVYQAADTKLTAKPMSAGGNIGGKYYSGQEVVNHKISDSDTSVAFNERINQDLSKAKNPTLVAGHMKEITAPEAPGKLGLYGLYGADGKPIQNSAFTPHDTHLHTEYASGTRLVDDAVTVIKKENGKDVVTQMTLDDLMKDSNLSKAVSTSGKLNRYLPKENKPSTNSKQLEQKPSISQNNTKVMPIQDTKKSLPNSETLTDRLKKLYDIIRNSL